MAGSVTVELIGSESLVRTLKRRPFAAKLYTNFVRDLATDVERRAVIKAPTGVSGGGGGLRGSIARDRRNISKYVISVGSNLRYSKPVEFGSRPHWPPPGSLKRWARLKLGVPAARLDSADFLIRRKIASEGTDPQPFLNPALEETRRLYFPARGRRLLNEWGRDFIREVERGGIR